MADEQKTPATPQYKVSEKGRQFIQGNEGFSLSAYPDSRGYSIGWGHYGVNSTDKITEDQAIKYFNEDIGKVENFLNGFGFGVSQSQFDALADFVYNVGVTKASTSTLFGKVAANPNDETIKSELSKWIYSTDKATNKKVINDGLKSRRSKETELYFGEPYTGEITGTIPYGTRNRGKVPQQVQTEKVAPRFDFEKGILSGLSPIDITAMSKNLGVDVKPPSATIEEFMGKYPDVPQDKAQGLFDAIQENYKFYEDGKYSAAASRFSGLPATPYFEINAPGLTNKNTPKPIEGYYGDPTKLPMPGNIPDIQYTTDQLFSHSVPIAKTKEGTWIPTEELLKNGSYVQVEIGDPAKMEPPMYYRELNENEFGSAERMRTIFGDEQMFSSVGGSILRGLWAGGAPLIAKGTGSMVGVVGDLAAMVVGQNTNAFVSKDFERELQNWGNYHTHKNMDERMAAFDNWNSAWWNISNGVSQMGSMMAAGYLTGGGLVSAGVGIKLSRRLALESALWLGSAEGGSGFRESMREMGVPDDVSAMWYFPFAAATYASERLLTPNVVQNFGGDLAIRNALGMTKRELMETVNNAAGRTVLNDAVNLAEKTKMNIAKRAWRGFAAGNFKLAKVAESSAWGRVGVSSFEEAFEELTEGAMDVGISYIANGRMRVHADVIDETFDGVKFEPSLENMKQDPETGTMYNATPWKMVDKNGSTKYINQEQYEEYQQLISFAKGVKAGTIKLDTSQILQWDQAAMAGISTMLAMGFGSIFNKNMNKARKNTTLELAMQEYNNPRLEAENERIGEEWIKSGALGKDNVPMNPEDPNSPSQARATWKSFRDEVNYWKTLVKAYKLDSREFRHATNSDPGLLKEALLRADRVEQLNSYITKTKAGEQGIIIPDELKNKTEAEAAAILAEASASLNEAIKPKPLTFTFNGVPKTSQYTELFSDRIRRTMAVDINMRKIAELEAVRNIKLEKTDPNYKATLNRLTQTALNDLYKTTNKLTWQLFSIDVDEILPEFNKANPDSFINKFNTHLTTLLTKAQEQFDTIPDVTDVEVQSKLNDISNTIGEAFKGFDINNPPTAESLSDIMGSIHKVSVDNLISDIKELTKNSQYTKMFDRSAFKARLQGIKQQLEAAAQNIIGFSQMPQTYTDLMESLDSSIGNAETFRAKKAVIDSEMQIEAFMNALGSTVILQDSNTKKPINNLRELMDRYTTLMKDPNSDIDNGAEVENWFKIVFEHLQKAYLYNNMNHDFFKNTLETNEKLAEHSLLVNDPVSSHSTPVHTEIKQRLLEMMATANDIGSWSHNKSSNVRVRRARIRLAYSDVNVALMNFIHVRYPKVDVEGFIDRINKLLENPTEQNGKEKIDSITRLYELIAENLEANKPITYFENIAREIEAEIIDFKDSLGGKLDDVIKDFKKSYKIGYFQMNDFENQPVLDSNSRTLGGLLTAKSYEIGMKGYDANITSPQSKRSSQEEEMFVWFTLTELNRMNLAGRNNTPSYKASYTAMRSVLKDKKDAISKGEFYMPFSDQEILVQHMLLFSSNPDASALWKGTPEKTRYAPNFLNIRGYGGVGKTRVISKIFLESYLRLHQEKKPVLKIIVPNADLQTVWEQTLISLEDRIDIHYEYIDNVDIDNEPADIIFIDESSLVPSASITEIIKAYGHTEVPVMSFGDDYQTNEFTRRGARGKYTYATPVAPMPKIGERTMPAINVWRTQQVSFYTSITALRNAIHDPTQDKDSFGKFKIKENNNNEKIGLEYLSNSAKVLKAFEDYVNSHKGIIKEGEAVLIVSTTEEKENLIATFAWLENYRNNIKTLEYDWATIKLLPQDQRAALRNNVVSGMQARNIFFYSDLANVTLPGMKAKLFDRSDNSSRIQYLRAKMTAESRVIDYLVMVGDESNQQEVPQSEKDETIPGYMENRVKSLVTSNLEAWDQEIGEPGQDGKRTGRLYQILRGAEDVASTQKTDSASDHDITEPLSDAAHDDVVAQTKTKRNSITRKTPVPDGSVHVTELIGEQYREAVDPTDVAKLESNKFHSVENKMFHAALRHVFNNTDETLADFENVFSEYMVAYQEHYKTTINDQKSFATAVMNSIILNERLHSIVFNDLTVTDPQLKFKEPGNKNAKTVYGHPMLIEIIGYQTIQEKGKKDNIVPIVNIHDVRFVNGKVEFSNYSKAKLASYMVMMANDGYIVNDAIVHHIQIDIANRTTENYDTYSLSAEDKVIFGKEVTNHLFGDQKYFNEDNIYADESDMLANERIQKRDDIPIHAVVVKTEGTTRTSYRIEQFVHDRTGEYAYATNLTSNEREKIPIQTLFTFGIVDPYSGRSIRMFNHGAFLFTKSTGWSTANVFVQVVDSTLSFPKDGYFYDINNNDLLRAKQLVVNQLVDGIRLRRILGNGMKGLKIDSRTGKVLLTDYSLDGAVLLELEDEHTIKMIIENEPKLMEILSKGKWFVHGAKGIKKPGMGVLIDEFKKNGLQYIAVENEVEYDYGDYYGHAIKLKDVKDPDLQKKVENYYTLPLTPEEQENLLNEIFAKAFKSTMRVENEKDILEDNGVDVNIKEDRIYEELNILKNKHAMRLRRSLLLGETIDDVSEFVDFHMLDGGNTMQNPIDNQGRRQTKTLAQLVNDLERNGLDVIKDENGDVKIGESAVEKGSKYFIEVKRGGGSIIQIPVNGRMATTQDIQDMIDSIPIEGAEGLNEIIKEIEEEFQKASKDKSYLKSLAKNAFSLLRGAEAMQFVFSNDKQLSQLVENNPKGIFAGYLYNDPEFGISVRGITVDQKLTNLKNFMKTLIQNGDELEKSGIRLYLTPYGKKANGESTWAFDNIVSNYSNVTQHGVLFTQNVPRVDHTIDGAGSNVTSTAPSDGIGRDDDSESGDRRVTTTVEPGKFGFTTWDSLDFQTEQFIRIELRQILGNVADSNTFLREDLLEQGVLGRVMKGLDNNFNILMGSRNGMSDRNTARHEAMHYIMFTLLKEDQRLNIMDQAREMMKERGIEDLSRQNTHEFIADMFMNREYLDYKPKGILQKFFRWLADTFGLWFQHKNDLINLMYSAEAGKFVNVTTYNNNIDVEANRIIKNIYTEAKNVKAVQEIFYGDPAQFFKISRDLVGVRIKENSPYGKSFNRNTDMHKTMKLAYNEFNTEYLKIIKLDPQQVTWIKDGQKVTDLAKKIEDMTPADYKKAILNSQDNRNIIKYYRLYHLGNPNKMVFGVMAQHVMESIDIEDELKGKTHYKSGKFVRSEANEESNPEELLSPWMSLLLRGIPLRSAITNRAKGDSVEGDRTKSIGSMVVPYAELDSMLDRAMHNVKLMYGIQGASISRFFDEVTRMMDHAPTGKYKNILWSFLMEFGPASILENLKQEEANTKRGSLQAGKGYIAERSNEHSKGYINWAGYYALLNNQMIYKDPALSAVRASIDDKRPFWEEAVKAMYRTYLSKTPRIRDNALYKDGKVEIKRKTSLDVDLTKSSMLDNARKSTLGYNNFVKQWVVDAIMPKEGSPLYLITKDGVKAADGRILIDPNNFGATTINSAYELFRLMGFFDVDKKTLAHLYPEATLRKNVAADKEDWALVIKNLYFMAHATKLNIMLKPYYDRVFDQFDKWKEARSDMDKWIKEENEKRVAEKKPELTEAEQKQKHIDIPYNIPPIKLAQPTLDQAKLVYDFYEATGMDYSPVTQIQSTEYTSREFIEYNLREHTMYPSAVDFWQIFQDIIAPAKIEIRADEASRVTISVDGTYEYQYPLSSTYYDKWSSGVGYPKTKTSRSKIQSPADIIRNDFKKEVKDGTYKNESPLAVLKDGKLSLFNPLLSGKIAIDAVDVWGGIDGPYRGVKHDKMIAYDMFRIMFDGFFKSYMMKPGNKILGAFHDTVADKPTIPNMSWMVLDKNTGTPSMESRLVTIRKKGIFLSEVHVDSIVLSRILEDFIGYYQNAQDLAKKNYARVKGKTLEQIEKMDGIEEGRDYIITKDGTLLPGKAVEMTNNPYLSKALKGWEGAKANQKHQMIRRAFDQQFREFVFAVQESGYNMYEIRENKIPWEHTEEIEQDGKKVKVPAFSVEVDGEILWHPIFETVFWSHHIINESMAHLNRGSSYDYFDITDYVKRAAGLFAPGESYVVGEQMSYLREHARVQVFNDFQINNPVYGPGKPVTTSDGYSILNAVTHEQMKRDTGRYLGNVYNGALKNVNFHYDHLKNVRTYLKFAQFPVSATMYKNDRFHREAQRAMIGDKIGNLKVISSDNTNRNFKPGGLDTFYEKMDNDFDAAIREITDFLKSEMGQEYHDSMVDYAVFRSTFKSGAKKIHQFKTKDGGIASSFEDAVYPTDANDDSNIVKISNRTMRLQTITYQDTIDPEKTIPTQLLYILGALPNNFRVINNINTALSGKVAQHSLFIKELNKSFGDRKAYLVNLGMNRLTDRQLGGKFMALAGNMGIHPDVLRDKHIQNYVSEVNDFLKPTMPGQNFIQAPSTMDIYERKLTVLGRTILQPFLFEDAIKIVDETKIPEGGFKPGDDLPGFTKRKINPRTYKSKNGTDAVTKEKILANPEAYSFEREEIITAFPYIDKFGLYMDDPNGRTTSKPITLAEAFTVRDIDMQPINFYGFDAEQIVFSLKALQKNIGDIFLSMKSAQRAVILGGIGSREEFREWQKKGTPQELMVLMGDYFQKLTNSLDSFIVRIPTTNASSGSSSKIVAFTYDAANTIFISPTKNILDGTDFDIDAIQAYFRPQARKHTVKRNGKEVDIYSVDQMQETIFNSIQEYYNDSYNAPLILERIDLSSFEKRADETNKKFNISASNPGGMVQSTAINMAGKNLVGHYANLMNFMMRLFAHYGQYQAGKLNSTLSGLENIKILEGSPTDVRERIIKVINLVAKFINAATDNAKLGGLLGRLNVNEATTPVIHGMILSGLTEEEIFDQLLNNQELIKASQTTMNSRKANNMFPTRIANNLSNPILKKYANIGEQLRRLGDIAALQQGIKADTAEFYRSVRNVEIALGMPMEEFLTMVQLDSSDPVNKDHLSSVPIESFKGMIYYQNTSNTKLTEETEIRKAFDIRSVVANHPNLLSYVEMLSQSREFFRTTFTVDAKKFDEVRSYLMDITKSDLGWTETIEGVERGIEDYMIGRFLTDNHKQVNLFFRGSEGQSVVAHRRFDQFNLSKMTDRVRFTLLFPEYVEKLKNDPRFQDNQFIQRMKIETRIDNYQQQYVEFSNSIYVDEYQKIFFHREFMRLDDDIKQAFRAYQMLVYGFYIRNGSYTEFLDIETEKAYSEWIKTLNYKKINAKEIAFGIALKNPGILAKTEPNEKFQNIKRKQQNPMMNLIEDRHVTPLVAARIFSKGGYQMEDIYDMWVAANYGDVTERAKAVKAEEEFYAPIFDPYPNWINTYTHHVGLTGFKPFHNLTIEEHFELLLRGSIKVVASKMERVALTPPVNYSSKFLQHQKIYSAQNIISGDYITLPDGNVAQVEKLGYNEVRLTLLKPTEKSLPKTKEELKNIPEADRLSREEATAGRDFIDVVLWKLKQVFPNIKFRLTTTEDPTNLYPNDYAYVKNGEVWINTDIVKRSSPFHEYGHIIQEVIRIANPTLFARLRSEAQNIYLSDTSFRNMLDEYYSDISEDEKIREIMAAMIGWNTAKDTEKFFARWNSEYLASKNKTFFDKVKDIIQKIRKWFNETFSAGFGLAKPLQASDLSLETISSIMVQLIDSGHVATYISSSDYGRLRRVIEHSTRAFTHQIGNMKDVYDNLSVNYAIDRDAQRAVLIQRMKEQATNDIRNNFHHLSAGYSGKEELFTDMNSDTTRKRLEEIADIVYNRSKTTYEGVVTLFKSAKQGGMNGNAQAGNLERLFGKSVDGELIFKPEIFTSMKKQIGYSPFTEVYKYSELKDHKTLGHLYNPAFEAFEEFNPTVFVHQIDKDQISVSLYDFTTERYDEFVEGTIKGNLARDFVSDNKAKYLGITMTNNKVDVRKLMIGMIGANMMQQDHKVQVFDQGVILFNRGSSHAFFLDPVNFRKTIGGLNQIPEFKKTIKDPTVNDIFDKPLRSAHQDYWKLIVDFYKSSVGDWWKYGMDGIVNDASNLNMNERIKVLSYRFKRVMAGRSEESTFTPDELYEIKILQEAIYDLKAIPWMDGQENSMRPTTALERTLFDSNSIGNDYFQRMRDQVVQSSRKIVARIWQQKAILYDKGGVFDQVKEVYDRTHSSIVEERVHDITGKMWSPLFAKIKTDKGEAEIGAIYWTKDEKECSNDMERMLARQAREKNIDDKLLKAGRQVSELISEYYAKLILANRLNDYQQSPWVMEKNNGRGGMYDIEDARKELTDMSKTSYFRGFVPVLPKSMAEFAAEGKMLSAMKQKIDQVSDIYELFEENTNQGQRTSKVLMELNDMFFFQLGFKSNTRTQLGSHQRTKQLLGLEPEFDKASNDIKWKLADPHLNSRMSKDMEKILMYFMMGVERKTEYEENVLPMINGVKIYLQEKYAGSNVDTKGMIDHLNIFTKMGIMGELKQFDVPGMNLNAMVGTLQGVASPLVMAGNVNIPIMSLVTNALYAMTEGIARHFVDDGIFNAGEIVKASAMFMTDHAKVVQLAIDLQVISMTEYDMMHFRKRLKTKKYVASNYLVNYLNWSADYYGRAVVMVAQMLHDGSWNAYSIDAATGKLKYDPNKDQRFSKRSTDPAQMALYKEYKKYMIADGIWGQTEDGELVGGYFNKMAQRFKALSDKYVVGSYGIQEKALINWWLIGRAASMFYNWFFSRFTSAFQPEGFNEPLGKLVVVKDHNGQYIGQWERQAVGGYIATISNYVRNIVTVGKFKRWQDLNKIQKINMIKTITIVAEFAGIMLMYAAVVNDDKDKKKPVPNWRIVRNLKYATYSLLVVPTMVEWARNPFAAIDIISGIFIDPMGNFRVRVPGKTQIDTITELFDENQTGGSTKRKEK